MRLLRSSFDSKVTALGVLVLATSALGACRSKQKQAPAAQAAASASALPLDRLAPGELAPSKTEVFGFALPLGMVVETELADRAYARGNVSPEDLANYVRTRVAASHVELGAASTLFPAVRIQGGPLDRTFSFEVLRDREGTRLIIRDVTPPPPPPPGLTPEERWRAAGMSPDGRPLDMKKLE
jgi:hypothetical protein